MKPVGTSIRQYLPMVMAAEWISACEKILSEDGGEQFLVNLPHVLRESLAAWSE